MNGTTGIPGSWQMGVQWLLPIGVIGLVGVMVIPLPPLIIDLLLSLDVALSIIVLLSAVSVTTAKTFSGFPSALLLLTVFRLGLNIATTRRILLHGPEGPDAAGTVIQAFGQFVVGGNFVVGLVIFLVLLAVQFLVINHGATRISEVTARFTLDAMPGKQMAIDADLNAGLIDDADARARRKEIAEEADFFGSMDGATRFTQRDAVASLIIVAVNLIAGITIGVLQAGIPVMEAMRTYSILTVGDGLVSAIPALLISVAGAMLTTRSATGQDLGIELTSQVFAKPRPLAVAAGALCAMSLIPGLPTVAFLTLGSAIGGLAWTVSQRQDEPQAEPEAAPPPPVEEAIEPMMVVDPLAIEVGYDLVELAGSDRSGGLLDRIREIRRQTALDLGLVVPPVRVRDNLRLAPDEYQILLRGAELARTRLKPGHVLAIDPGEVIEPVQGEKTLDPAFGIEALWIREELGEHARSVGYTVVDRTSVLATHISQVIRRHAPALLGRQETQKLLDTLAKTAPKLVEELIPERYTVGQIQKVLQALLRESVSIRDLHTIGETMADCALEEISPTELLNRVRRALGRALVQPLLDKGALKVLTVAPEIEKEILALLQADETSDRTALDPTTAHSLAHRVAQAVRHAPAGGPAAVLCNSAQVRASLRRLTESILPTVPILATAEIPTGIQITAVGQVQ